MASVKDSYNGEIEAHEFDLSRSEIERLNEEKFGITRVGRNFTWPDDKEPGRVFGIDVSHHQGRINWPNVKTADPAFSYIRATFGQTVDDREHEFNFSGADDLGVLKGAYHFLTRSGDPKDQIDRFLERYEPHAKNADLPPCIDFEPYYPVGSSIEQWGQIPVSERIDKLGSALDRVELKHGRKPIVYTNGNAWRSLLGADGNVFQSYKIWIARYGGYEDEDPNIMEGFTWWLWQFTDLGTMPGITVNTVDSNIVTVGDDLDPYRQKSVHAFDI